MKKESQSIFWQGPSGSDAQQNSLLNFLTGVVMKKNQIGDKEANMLYRLWNKQAGKKGDLMAVPKEFSIAELAILKEKNLIKGEGSFVTITDEGASLIKKIVLTSEKNTFEYPDQEEKEYVSMDAVRKRLHASKAAHTKKAKAKHVASKKEASKKEEPQERTEINSLTDHLYEAISKDEKA